MTADASQAQGAASWILAAGLSLSLHMAAATLLVVGLPGAPETPSSPGTGIIVRNMAPEVGTRAAAATRPAAESATRRQAGSEPAERVAPQAPADSVTDTAEPRTRQDGVTERPDQTRLSAQAPRRVGSSTGGGLRPDPVSAGTVASLAASVATANGPIARVPAGAGAPVLAQRTAPSQRPDPAPAQVLEPAQVPTEDLGKTQDPAQLTHARAASVGTAPVTTAPDTTAAGRTGAIAPARRAPETTRPTAAVPATGPAPSRRVTPQRQARAETPPHQATAPSTATDRVAQVPREGLPTETTAPQNRVTTAVRETTTPDRRTRTPPQETEDPATRATRDGPNRRLSDRSAAPLDEPAAAGRTPAERAFARAIGTARAIFAVPCRLIRPERGPEGQRQIALYSPEPDDLARLSARLDQATAPPPGLVQHSTTRAQCAALDYVRDMADDPFTGVDLHLQHASVGADRPLAGSVLHPLGQGIGLFLLDPAGRVYDLADFVETTPGFSRFSVPLRRKGGAMDGALLLLAIASPGLEKLQVRARETPRATSFFAAARRINGNVDLSMAGIVLD